MNGKISKAVILVLMLSLATAGVAYAEEDAPAGRNRFLGEITNVDETASTFRILTRAGDDVSFKVNPATLFRSPDGSVGGLSDLKVGMHALVTASGSETGGFVAKLVVTRAAPEERKLIRALGEITSVDLSGNLIDLTKRDGEVITFQVGDRTRFRSRDGEIEGIEDLEPGMIALVRGVRLEEGGVLATIVAVGQKDDIPSNLHRVKGEITKVVPGQGTFTIETPEGESLTIQTSERTRFRSRDGSVEDIHDLKKGMATLVGVVEQQDGTLLALLVVAGSPQEVPERPKIDVRAGGRIVEIGAQTFTLETRNTERKVFTVDGSTVFKSRDGSVNGLDDLEIGMIAIVGGQELGSGQLKAVWVGVGQPPSEPPIDTPDQPGGMIPGMLFTPAEM
jgi:hypothetical protein